jgi:mannose/cellobiose epimerase-like protein (N-acyl-D-glucosamine 2-epimerase family)
MHFVEALNVWFEATQDDRFNAHAERILTLFEDRFVDRNGALLEFFGNNWERLEGPLGEVVEPGHQFEWAWIIGHRGRMSGHSRVELIRRLLDSALRAGFDTATGLTVDEVDRTGHVVRGSKRLWPQTEAIKGALAGAEFLGEDTSQRISSILASLFSRFLYPGPIPGTWIDRYDEHWMPIVDKVPAISLYHITLAFLELLRVAKEELAPLAAPADLATSGSANP